MTYKVYYYLKTINNAPLLFLLPIKVVFFFRLFLISSLCSFILLSTTKATEIIVNNSVPNQHYTLNDIRAIFMMRMTLWANGKPIRVFVLPDNHPTHQAFTKKKLGIFPHQLRRFWNRLVDSGTGNAPTEVHSLTEMLQSVATTPYAIGYSEDGGGNHKNIRLLDY